MSIQNDITVVYNLWLPYGFEPFKAFIESYIKYPAGFEHKLIIIIKDGKKEELEDLTIYTELLAKHQTNYQFVYFNGGYDIDAYFSVANKIESEYFFFLNTNSVLLADNWLLNMYKNICLPNVGVCSATGSWMSYRSAVFVQNSWKYDLSQSLQVNFSKYKLLLKALFYYPFLFASFPNPHIRTNGFIIKRNLFLKIKLKPIQTKIQAYIFESGRKGFSDQVLDMGFEVRMVDKNGNSFIPKNWSNANVFWYGNQENLMIEDNQTVKYIEASEEEKRLYSKLAWGKTH